MSINNQESINATKNVKTKLIFDREAQSQGIVLKGYHTYNRIFNASDFMEELLKKQKYIRFSGAGASHKNGAVECAINMVVTLSSTMLTHPALICPEENVFTHICPMQMYYAL